MAKKKEKEFTNIPIVKVNDQVTSEQHEVFRLVTQDGKTYVTIDKYMMTKQPFDSVEAAKQYIDSKPWQLIINAACCIQELSNQSNNK